METAHIIYLVLFALFIGASVLRRYRGRMKQGTLHFLIWVGIIFVLVLLYSFRHEFSSVKNRLTGELFPSSATVTAAGALELRKSGDGHFHADARINKHTQRFLIDTGATGNVISVKTAKAAGIITDDLIFSSRMNTANGTVTAARTRADITVGPYVFKDLPVLVSSGAGDTNVLGMRFLSLFSSYEVRDNKLVLRAPKGAITVK